MRAVLSALHVAVAAELLTSGGSVQLRNDRQQSAGGEQFFAYDYSKHGQEWTAGSCASRSRQSPIDLPANIPITGTFAFKYEKIVEPFELMNNGHTYSSDLTGLGYGGITYENAWYNLLNVNVHSLSEHTWTGMQQPLELHLVHKRYDGEALLIVAIAVESPLLTAQSMAAALAAPVGPGGASALFQFNASRGAGFLESKQMPPPSGFPQPAGAQYMEPPANEPGFNPTLQAFVKMPPPPVNMKVRVPADHHNSYDLNEFLRGGTFYEYAGSLTAPPCAEIATWLVRKQPIKASDKQVMYLHDAVYRTTADFGNYRSLMPLNGRVIAMRQGVYEDAPPTAAPPVPMPGHPQQSDREFRAMKWAMDAMTIAKSATDYVKDLDSRLRSAAQAHANALAPQLEPLSVHGQVVVPANAAEQAALGGQPLPNSPGANYMHPTMSPMEMQKTAETMARTLATAAREEIEDATEEIHAQSKEVAMKAAREAAKMVMSGQGNHAAMASSVAPVPGAPPGMMSPR